ncbi:unnamed protein product [Microthlaspi erraticum]|uniref:Uncharacterized protein n=1 Tax=Microthlaspi erraticum TaxID=1685480 RepID=A0A6D2ITZ0_9BRAS|nr:unnamed protein product [Microthlaspi erraticum]
MKRSYNQKSEDCPDGSIENQRPTAQSGWPRNECSTLGQISSVRLKSRPKSKPSADHAITTRETKPAVGQATPPTPRTTKAREPGTSLAAAQLLAYHAERPSEPGTTPASGREFHRPNLHPSDHSGRPRSVRPRRPFRLGHDPIPADRPDRPSQRRGRPEARFEARFHIFKARLNPKPPQKT